MAGDENGGGSAMKVEARGEDTDTGAGFASMGARTLLAPVVPFSLSFENRNHRELEHNTPF